MTTASSTSPTAWRRTGRAGSRTPGRRSATSGARAACAGRITSLTWRSSASPRLRVSTIQVSTSARPATTPPRTRWSSASRRAPPASGRSRRSGSPVFPTASVATRSSWTARSTTTGAMPGRGKSWSGPPSMITPWSFADVCLLRVVHRPKRRQGDDFMALERRVYPFTAIVGQEKMKLGLILNAINSGIGGVLIRGERGTAKSTAVRALAALLAEQVVVEGCEYGCDPDQPDGFCDECRARLEAAGGPLPRATRRMRVVELPVNASEDRVVGTIDLEAALTTGTKRFEGGVLGAAHRNVLYVDEVNLLDDHIVDVLLDAAAMGVNIVEREGFSIAHPARFILVGTMNPDEGDLRPQLLDRFGLCVDVAGMSDVDARVDIADLRTRWDRDPVAVSLEFEPREEALRTRIRDAIKRCS